ncbi:MAG: hypothetical protein ABEJ79_09865, partial [Halolamina sp.]
MDDGSREDDLEALVGELESTLGSLREAVDQQDETTADGPSPPTLPDLVRFTERYTIPTLIASLEATIRALELFRGALRLADPQRDLGDGDREDGDGRSLPTGTDVAGDIAAATGNQAAQELRRRLTRLREELAAANEPTDAEARDVLAEARDLAAELDQRLSEPDRPGGPRESGDSGDGRTRSGTADRAGGGTDTGGVRIDVTEGGSGSNDLDDDGVGADDGDNTGDAEATVNVEAELDSIKDELDEHGDG